MTIRLLWCFLAHIALTASAGSAELRGTVVDFQSGQPIPARVYVQSESGEWLFVQSNSDHGSAAPYREQWVPTPQSVERHTTVSAHPFQIELAPGKYKITIERGKEYAPLSRAITVSERSEHLREAFRLRRWVNMAERGWYSGETHVHRRISELANVMIAEDLNVAFPVTFWTTKAYEKPNLNPSTLRRQGPSPFGRRVDRGHESIQVDDTHIIYPRNTEYEVFSVEGRSHVLGAMFLLNHQSILNQGAPPVAEIARQAHREGALIDLDKHNWPWSMMLVPIAKVDLFQLSNNSVWRTEFGFRRTSVPWASYMKIESDASGMSELGWLNFGFENYYSLLNCGFRLQPTAGTASGVHPVPLGYSRVYVHLNGDFDGDAWVDGLRKGRSFVTNGPMLFVTTNQKRPGHVFSNSDSMALTIAGEVYSERPLERIELVVNGRSSSLPSGTPETTSTGALRYSILETVEVAESSWAAVRCFEASGNGRIRFAHTAPWHFEIGNQPVRPRREEIDYLIQRVRREINRNQGVLTDAALEEFREALRIYLEIAERAED